MESVFNQIKQNKIKHNQKPGNLTTHILSNGL